jgi:hypothetical protein
LIIENVQQLFMTAFTAGVPSVTTDDDAVSRNQYWYYYCLSSW